MNTKMFIKKELEHDDFVHEDAIRAIRCWWVNHTEQGGYAEGEYVFHLFNNGGISISGEGDGQFFSIDDKETLDILREFLNINENPDTKSNLGE